MRLGNASRLGRLGVESSIRRRRLGAVRLLILIAVAGVGAAACSSAATEPDAAEIQTRDTEPPSAVTTEPADAAEIQTRDTEQPSAVTTEPADDAASSALPPPSDDEGDEDPPDASGVLALADGSRPPPAPTVPEGPLDAALVAELDLIFSLIVGDIDTSIEEQALARVGGSGDARVAWLLADLLRFFQVGSMADTVVRAFEQLTQTDVPAGFAWPIVTDWLIAWDTPAPPGYVTWKRILFERVEPAWAPFFDDADAAIDWRLLSWGGVLIDNRPISEVADPCPRGCIPALNDPAVTDAAGGDWLADRRIVFGVVVNGDARAYPKRMMEVHELVNDTLGGRRIGIPYCTLCGSAQAYYTDRVPAGFQTIELRTSGLLSRSNKVMFDLHTFSVFDTFRGVALSGPLQDESYSLEMLSVVTSTWGEWKAAYPDTTIVAQDGGIGRTYPLDPLRGRDDDGPIFPVGAVDSRLPVQEPVLGIETPEGQAIAFPVAQARAALETGATVMLAGVRLTMDAGGLRAELADGTPIASHQAFWFAWSQFHPETAVWTPLS